MKSNIIIIFTEFGDEKVDTLLEKFGPALKAAGLEPDEVQAEWTRLKSLVYSW